MIFKIISIQEGDIRKGRGIDEAGYMEPIIMKLPSYIKTGDFVKAKPLVSLTPGSKVVGIYQFVELVACKEK